MRLHADVPRSGTCIHVSACSLSLLAWLAPLALSAQSLTIVSGNNQSLVPNQASQPLVGAGDATRKARRLSGATIGWSSPNATAGFRQRRPQTDSRARAPTA